MHRLGLNVGLLWLTTISVGCSTLGFSTTPVAHTMTAQTKQVLGASPRHPMGVTRELNLEVLATHYLQPGDELLLELDDVEFDIRLPADQTIAADGTIDLGKYGRTKVAGLTLEESEERIESGIAAVETKRPGVNARLIQSVERYYVIGEVNSPGSYPLIGFETVLDGIVAAGGLTPRASACDLLLARPTDPCSCRVTLPVCYGAITQLGDTKTNYQLKPGDRIFVGRQTLWEELMHCCGYCAKSCDRCTRPQTACCDPLIADVEKPNFIPTNGSSSSSLGKVHIPTPTPTLIPSGSVDVQVEEIDIQSPTPIFDPNSGSTQRMDGELEFDELLEPSP